MGWLATLGAEVRFDRGAWLNDDEDDGVASVAGPRVSATTAQSLTTVWRCVDLISHTVAIAPRDVFLKVGGRTFPQYTPPPWLVAPDPNNANYTADDYFAEQTAAMLLEGNFFTRVYPNVGRPVKLIAIPPDRVRVKSGPLYEVLDAQGKVVETLGPDQMLHGWWRKAPGERRGMSPLEYHRRTLGGAIAADEYAGRFFGQGASLAFGVEVPGTLTPEQKEALSAALARRHQGLSQSHAIGILTAGAKFVTGLAPSPEQAQMLATRKFSVEDTARIYGVPPGMVGSQEPGASSYASDVEKRKQFRDDAVLKFTRKLEAAHERLLSPPVTVPDGEMKLRFNLDWVARASLKERYEAHEIAIRGGFGTPDEERAYEDRLPLPGGDRLYMQTQMTPIDQLGTKTTGGNGQ